MAEKTEKGSSSSTEHVLDLAARFRTANEAADRTVGKPQLSCILQGVRNGVTVMAKSTFEFGVSTWSPMFAPTSYSDATLAGGTQDVILQDIANPPWDVNNVGNRKKHLAKYPTTIGAVVPKYAHIVSSALVPTAIWASLPDDAASPLSETLSMHRPWQGDIKLGMSLQNLAYLGAMSRGQHKNKNWNPTGWLMNIYTYLLSTDAERFWGQDELAFWQVTGNALSIQAADAVLRCPVMDHIASNPDALVAATAADDTVSIGYLPVVTTAGGNAFQWEGVVEQAAYEDFGHLFHCTSVTDGGGNAVTANCYGGNRDNDADIVFTTDLLSAVTRYPELADYPHTSVPTAFLETATSSQQRSRRIAMWVLGINPSFATLVASVTETSAGGNEAEGLMYWNGGKIAAIPMRKMVVVVPMEVHGSITNPAHRLTSTVIYGPRDVVYVRQYGFVNVHATGAVVGSGTAILAGNIATEQVSASAYLASWQGEFRREDWSWYLEWVRSKYKCENCAVDAIERVESMVGLLRPGVCTLNEDLATESYRSGRYTGVYANKLGVQTAYRNAMWSTVVGPDHVLKTRCEDRECIIPMFFAELADKIAMGLYTLATVETTRALPDVYTTKDGCLTSVLAWNLSAKSVKYDAVFTGFGAPVSEIVRSHLSQFSRGSAATGDAAEDRARLPQDQWLDAGSTLWTTYYGNEPVPGWQYVDFVEVSNKYAKHVGAKQPCESFLLEPPQAKSSIVAAVAAASAVLLDWFCYGGPHTAAGAPNWVPGAGAVYPNLRFQTGHQPSDFGLLFSYVRAGTSAAVNCVNLQSDSYTAKGCYSWLVHEYFGLAIKPFNAMISGTALPYNPKDSFIADSEHDQPYQWLATAKAASGTSVSVDFQDWTSWPYEFERDLTIMDQVDGFNDFIISTNRSNRVIFDYDNDVDERLAYATICFCFKSAINVPPAGGDFDTAMINLSAARLNRFTPDMRWLYFYSSEQQLRDWWDGAQEHINRPQPLEYAVLSLPAVVTTIRGRDRILVDMRNKCKPAEAEVHVPPPPPKGADSTNSDRKDQDREITRPVIVDTQVDTSKTEDTAGKSADGGE